MTKFANVAAIMLETNLNNIYDDVKKDLGAEDFGSSLTEDILNVLKWGLTIGGFCSIAWGIYKLVKHDKKGWWNIAIGLLAIVLAGILFVSS